MSYYIAQNPSLPPSRQTDGSNTVLLISNSGLKPNNPNNFSAEYCFHWVGQGLFCSGTIGGFRFIYDCGGERGSKTGKDFVREAVESLKQQWGEQEVDLLVLSHLHADHINGFNLLKNHFTIKRIMIPYSDQSMLTCYRLNFKRWRELNGEETNYELNYMDDLYKSERPDGWFREYFDCRNVIVYGKSSDEDLLQAGLKKNIRGEGYHTSFIKNLPAWLFFYQPGFDAKKASEYKQKIGNNSLEDVLSNPKLKNQLKQSRLFLNDSSLVMMVKADCETSLFNLILTGDFPETKNRNLNKLQKHIPCTVLQVPHHGGRAGYYSIKDASVNVISCGIKNRYKHPSKFIFDNYPKQKTITMRELSSDVWLKFDSLRLR